MSGDNYRIGRSKSSRPLDSQREMCSKNVLHSDFQSVVGKSEDKGDKEPVSRVRRKRSQSTHIQSSMKQRKESKRIGSQKKIKNIQEVSPTEEKEAQCDTNTDIVKTRISKRQPKTGGHRKLSSAEVYNEIRAIVAPDGQEICTARIVKSPALISTAKEKVNKEISKNMYETVDCYKLENKSFIEDIEDQSKRRQSVRRQNYFEGILLQKLSPAEVYNQIRGIVAPKGEEICVIKRQVKSVASQDTETREQEKNIAATKGIEKSKTKSNEKNGIQKSQPAENSEQRLSSRICNQNHAKASQGSLYNQILQILSPDIENYVAVRRPKTVVAHNTSGNNVHEKKNKSVIGRKTSVMLSVGNRHPSSESPGAIYRQIRGIVAPEGTEILVPIKKQTKTVNEIEHYQSRQRSSRSQCKMSSNSVQLSERTRSSGCQSDRNFASNNTCDASVDIAGKKCSRAESIQCKAAESSTPVRHLRSAKLCNDTYAKSEAVSSSVLASGPDLEIDDIEMSWCTRSGRRQQHSDTSEHLLVKSLDVASGGRAGMQTTEKTHDSLGSHCCMLFMLVH